MTTLICDLCGKSGAHERHVTRSYGKKSNLHVIENVPTVVCPHCGESYLTAETMLELARIKMHRKDFAVERTVPVAEFA
ncbi:MAG: type II toxin-antitoxin system MqsA family antitoxin [Candidatus Methanofishera endochildressiae]|uniref:Type II toxin-antitoxin system MqsA family antitoxin n=1 Tax=Candidatus Methanofishera endochildressiae TaxID=2738884 RepID=A0A7Z0MP79_9GAMM|nr:type II toxin-antitoxin system MqsA family antitoxin [Candidatus Methanofishera endochildressiae]